MSSTSSATRARAQGQQPPGKQAQGKQIHHGRTTAAWAGSIIAMVGFVVAAIAMIPHPNWVLLGVAGVLFVAAIVVTLVLRKLGHGAD